MHQHKGNATRSFANLKINSFKISSHISKVQWHETEVPKKRTFLFFDFRKFPSNVWWHCLSKVFIVSRIIFSDVLQVSRIRLKCALKTESLFTVNKILSSLFFTIWISFIPYKDSIFLLVFNNSSMLLFSAMESVTIQSIIKIKNFLYHELFPFFVRNIFS